jgi:hypothetical protein
MLMMSGVPLGGVIAGGLLNVFALPLMIAITAALTLAPGLIGLGIKQLRLSDI